MYALPNKTQHKLIVKVRGGISQKLDNFNSSTSTPNTNSNSSSIPSVVRNNKEFIRASSSSPSTPSPFKSVPYFRESALSKHIDDAGFEAELNNLPQPIFHATNEKNGPKSKSSSHHQFSRGPKQYITPEHNEMIKFVQQSWKGVERDYKKSVNNYIQSHNNHLDQNKHNNNLIKKKTATTSTPLLLSGSYHHTSVTTDSSSTGSRQDSFQPFDLETFWTDRMYKRLTEEI